MSQRSWLSPFALPVYFFGLTIVAGTVLLHHPISLAGGRTISWLDAWFTAVSATCVTGLVVVDTGTFFSRFGQNVILGLIQLGGLGVMTSTSLVFYLWRKRVSVTDRIAVGQSLLHDPRFHLGSFLKLMVLLCVVIEGGGAVLLHLADSEGFGIYSALFHSISAFCNAGFSLYGTSVMAWRHDIGVNLDFILYWRWPGYLKGTGFRARAVADESAGRAGWYFGPVCCWWYPAGEFFFWPSISVGGRIISGGLCLREHSNP